MIFPHISPHCKLLPVQNREYENGPSPPHPGGVGSYQYSSSLYIVHACIATCFFLTQQALREELQRRRGSSVGSGGTVEDAERIKSLEDELEKWVCSIQISHISLCPSGALSSKRLLAQGHGFFTPVGWISNSCRVFRGFRECTLPKAPPEKFENGA